jgi:hypothetical protein
MFDQETQCSAPSAGASKLPASLAGMEPGPVLAAFLMSLSDEDLSVDDRVAVLQAHQRLVSHFQAKVYGDMADLASQMVADHDGDRMAGAEEAATELRAALRYTRRLADSEMTTALRLVQELPSVAEALSAGRIDVRRATTIANLTMSLTAAATEWVVERIIDVAPRLTTGQLRARLERLCIEADPEYARRRHEGAVEQRRVVMEPNPDGTADLVGSDLPAHRVTAATRRINRLARSLRRKGESRTMDQLRADVYLDLLNGTDGESAGGRRGTVDIRVDLSTLAELSDAPGDLAGYGPVVAEISRRVADAQHDASWRYTITDPETEMPVATGALRRRPTAGDRRVVETLKPTCAFPGCRHPATECDLDHRVRHIEDGPATPDNLVPLCRHDHRIRHEHGWTHRPLGNGDHLWTSRHGRNYTTSGTPP